MLKRTSEQFIWKSAHFPVTSATKRLRSVPVCYITNNNIIPIIPSDIHVRCVKKSFSSPSYLLRHERTKHDDVTSGPNVGRWLINYSDTRQSWMNDCFAFDLYVPILSTPSSLVTSNIGYVGISHVLFFVLQKGQIYFSEWSIARFKSVILSQTYYRISFRFTRSHLSFCIHTGTLFEGQTRHLLSSGEGGAMACT